MFTEVYNTKIQGFDSNYQWNLFTDRARFNKNIYILFTVSIFCPTPISKSLMFFVRYVVLNVP